ncbi:MAG: hypothetical protein AVDCRST_MAG41-4293, partial [uncultured Corynebacteriales bacterium]
AVDPVREVALPARLRGPPAAGGSGAPDLRTRGRRHARHGGRDAGRAGRRAGSGHRLAHGPRPAPARAAGADGGLRDRPRPGGGGAGQAARPPPDGGHRLGRGRGRGARRAAAGGRGLRAAVHLPALRRGPHHPGTYGDGAGARRDAAGPAVLPAHRARAVPAVRHGVPPGQPAQRAPGVPVRLPGPAGAAHRRRCAM